MTDIAAGQIEAALDREVGFVFNLLCDQFAKDELLGEIFRADYDAALTGRAAGNEQSNE